MDETEQPTQTTPKGAEIPVPTREEFLRNMDKVAPAARPLEDEALAEGTPDAERSEGDG